MSPGQQLAAEAAWYRSEAERLLVELEDMTPGHREAIGVAAVRRMEVDADTFRQLAEEHEAYLARVYPELAPAAEQGDAEPGLF